MSSLPASPSVAIRSGHLLKRSDQLRRWNERWVETRPESRKLVYYMSRDDDRDESRGTISLDGCYVIPAEGRTTKRYSFRIYKPGHPSVYFGASSQSDMEKWVHAIRAIIFAPIRQQIGGQVFTWGANRYGQLGHGDFVERHRPQLVVSLVTSRMVSVAAGESHVVCVSEAGEVYSWGHNKYGQLGWGTISEAAEPTAAKVRGFEGILIQKLVCGFSHTVAVSRSGQLYLWGCNAYGQIGKGRQGDQPEPLLCAALRDDAVTDVACGSHHSVCRTATGTLYTWGYGEFGQLGHGDYNNEFTPLQVQSLAGVRVGKVACGSCHTVAILRSGDVYVWGKGSYGQLGHGDASSRQKVPCLLQTLQGLHIREMAGGEEHVLILAGEQLPKDRSPTTGIRDLKNNRFGDRNRGDGGDDDDDIVDGGKSGGNIGGNGSVTDVGPVIPPGNIGEVEIINKADVGRSNGGSIYITAHGTLKRDGGGVGSEHRLFSCGRGDWGQLGYPHAVIESLAPREVVALRNVVLGHATAGQNASYVITQTGKVHSWGCGAHGQLGLGDCENQLCPTLVSSLQCNAIVSLAAKSSHVAAVTSLDDPYIEVSGIPPEFFCPVTGKPMRDPVKAHDEICYERQAFEIWLARQAIENRAANGETASIQYRSPISGEIMSSASYIPQEELSARIRAFVDVWRGES